MLSEDNDDAKMKYVDMNMGSIPTNFLEDPHMMTESPMEDNNHVDFKSYNWCVDAEYVAAIEQSINFVCSNDEQQNDKEMKHKDVKQRQIIEVVDEMENNHQIKGSNVNMRDIAAELNFLE